MLIKVMKTVSVPTNTNQRISPKSNDPMKLSFVKAYSLVNVTDLFLEHKMKDGKPLEPLDISFFAIDASKNQWVLEQDYEVLLD
jgi:hypothetical protein